MSRMSETCGGATSVRRRMLGVTVALAALVATLGTAASAQANKFKPFEYCPLHDTEVTVTGCVYAKSTPASSFTAGNVTVPLTKPIILRGGFFEQGGEQTFVGAEGAPTLTAAPQLAPSLANDVDPSLLAQPLRATYESDIAKGETKVTATIELAGAPSVVVLNEENILEPEVVPGEGGKLGLGLPTKVKLSSAFLGPDCYVGSNGSPIEIELTTGKSGSLEGTPGELQFEKNGWILTISGDSLVNNTYEAPGATGCGEGGGADAAVNAKLGLPSAPGKNSAVIIGTLKQSAAEIVEEHL
jgi:hypothetical protein